MNPGQLPSPSRMPQVHSSLYGTVAPPVAKRTSTSGAHFCRSASRGMSQRVAKVGPTPIVSTRDPAIAATCAVMQRELVEDRRQSRLVGAPGGGEGEAVRLAVEQRHAEPLLEQLHHPADRRRRDVQLGGGARETFRAGGRLERAHAVEEGQLAQGDHHQESWA